ncbi:hypothetical protein [Actinokineospora sp.]|uniref:hypothetical protein n=1 Tax=Actinokineospora sp. TaxID=1872133 RepID=UPI003D6AA88E
MRIFMTNANPGYFLSLGSSVSPSWGPAREAIHAQRERLAVCTAATAGSKHARTLDVDVPTNPSATSGGVT